MGRSLSYESFKKAQISDLKVSIVLADSGWRTEKGQKLLHSSGSSARILQHAAPHTVLKSQVLFKNQKIFKNCVDSQCLAAY